MAAVRTRRGPGSTPITPAIKMPATMAMRRIGFAMSSKNGKIINSRTRPARRKRQPRNHRSGIAVRLPLLLAAAQRRVQSYQRGHYIPLSPDQFVLGGQPLSFDIEHSEIATHPSGVALARSHALFS